MSAAGDGDRERLLRAVDELRMWRRGAQRAPHKPLLLLLMLGRLRDGKPRLAPFTEVEDELRGLLRDFGPPHGKPRPEYPFWHLRSDGLWELAGPVETLARRPAETPPVSAARRLRGGLDAAAWQRLRDDAGLLTEVANQLVEAHFPASLHTDILDRVGLGGLEAVTARSRRDPLFRVAVLRAYEYRCAVCGYDGRVDAAPVGLEAAHVRWHAAGGPDDLGNGLALCVLHHKMLDLGVIGISGNRRVQVSQAFHGREAAHGFVARFAGAALLGPQRGLASIEEAHRIWHEREVFRAPARHVTAAAAEGAEGYRP